MGLGSRWDSSDKARVMRETRRQHHVRCGFSHGKGATYAGDESSVGWLKLGQSHLQCSLQMRSMVVQMAGEPTAGHTAAAQACIQVLDRSRCYE